MKTNNTPSTLSQAGKVHLFLAVIGVIIALIGTMVLLNDSVAAQATASGTFTLVKTPDVNVVTPFAETISTLLKF